MDHKMSWKEGGSYELSCLTPDTKIHLKVKMIVTYYNRYFDSLYVEVLVK